MPVTVKIRNYREFAPGEEIPLGYWNQERMAWEHEGFGVVDATGEWVAMSVTHFSPYDCNYTVLVPPIPDPNQNAPGDLTGDGPPVCNLPTVPCESGECPAGVDAATGTMIEDYALPGLPVLGRTIAPRLVYNSRRAVPGEVIDIEFAVLNSSLRGNISTR